MNFIIWFFISAAILEVLSTLFAYTLYRLPNGLTFKGNWICQQFLPVGGGIYVGIVATLMA